MTGTGRTFLNRLISTAVLWSVLLAVIFSGNDAAFFALIATLAMLGLWEFLVMLRNKGLPHFPLTALACGLAFLAGSFVCFRKFGLDRATDFEGAVSVALLLALFTRQMFVKSLEGNLLRATANTVFALLYVPALFNFVTKIVYALPGQGHWYVLFLVVVTKFSDMGAYLTGLVFGRHPMAPQISPKKTWEGFVGAMVFSVGGSYLACGMLGERVGLLTSTHAGILAVLLGFAAVVGDLAESALKRGCDVKDSGTLLPGIGGVLDLIDSLLFTAPILFFYLRLVLLVS